MRFTALAVISIISLSVGIAIAIFEAKAGYGYWDACVLNSVHAINWRPIPQIGWQRVTGAGIAICSAGAEHDDYRRQLDVSQENA
jgi:hypothetical protein